MFVYADSVAKCSVDIQHVGLSDVQHCEEVALTTVNVACTNDHSAFSSTCDATIQGPASIVPIIRGEALRLRGCVHRLRTALREDLYGAADCAYASRLRLPDKEQGCAA